MGQQATEVCGGETELCFIMLILKCIKESMGVVSQSHFETHLEFRGKNEFRD